MTLQQFYNDYAAWLDAGAPEGRPFDRGYGLCHNLGKFADRDAHIEMTRQFEAAGLDIDYPFTGRYQFETDFDNETMHLNPKRIQWVKDHAQ